MNRDFTVGTRPRLELRAQSGRVDIHAGEPGVIRLSIEGRGADAVTVEQHGDTVSVREDRGGWLRGGSVRMVAEVPDGSNLDISGAATDVFIHGSLGAIDVRTASGDLSFEDVDTVNVKSASGDVRGGVVRGDATVATASGDIYLDRVDGRLTASQASGDLRVDTVGDELRCTTASGELRVSRCLGDDISLKSVSGDVSIGLPKGTRLEADITTLSGEVYLPQGQSETPDGPRRRVRLWAKSISGDISIETFSV